MIEADDDGRILGFHEKNPDAPTMPGDPTSVYASMGNYIFSTAPCCDCCTRTPPNAEQLARFRQATSCPSWPASAEMFAYDFQTNRIPGDPPDRHAVLARRRDASTPITKPTWTCAPSIRALNLYNREWPLRTTSYPDPPAKFTFDEENRRGQAIDSIVSGGCILSGGTVRELGAGPRRARPLRRAGGGLRRSSTTATSAAARRSAARSSTRTSASRRTP